MDKTIIPRTYYEACMYQKWVTTMYKGIKALLINGTWVVSVLTIGKKFIGYWNTK